MNGKALIDIIHQSFNLTILNKKPLGKKSKPFFTCVFAWVLGFFLAFVVVHHTALAHQTTLNNEMLNDTISGGNFDGFADSVPYDGSTNNSFANNTFNNNLLDGDSPDSNNLDNNNLGDDLVALSTLSRLDNDSDTDIATAQADNTRTTTNAPNVASDELILNQPIIDTTGLLSPQELAHIGEQLKQLHQSGLAQMAVVLVPSTDGISIFDYTLAVANRWGLGNKDRDNGVLMLVAINDRKVFITTGYGVEGVLPDGALKRIIRQDITPAFKTGNYAGGISAGIARIDERLRADPETLAQADAKHSTSSDNGFIIPLFIMALIIGSFLTAILGRLLGASIGAGGLFVIGMGAGLSLLVSAIAAVILWLFLLARGLPIHTGGGGFGGGGGSFGGGSFGGGGFGGGGGFSGGGGSFGGGGAGGSW